MGNNSSTYDKESEYNKKSLTQLIAIKTQFEIATINHPNMKMINEHLEWIKMKIAERIGKDKGQKK